MRCTLCQPNVPMRRTRCDINTSSVGFRCLGDRRDCLAFCIYVADIPFKFLIFPKRFNFTWAGVCYLGHGVRWIFGVGGLARSDFFSKEWRCEKSWIVRDVWLILFSLLAVKFKFHFASFFLGVSVICQFKKKKIIRCFQFFISDVIFEKRIIVWKLDLGVSIS